MLMPLASALTRTEKWADLKMTLRAPNLKFLFRMLLCACGLGAVLCVAAAGDDAQACATDALNFGFYAYFPPVSYSADPDPEADGFQTHLGYEADLLSALEALEGAGLAFTRHPLADWHDIWLLAARPEYDVIGGAITILDSRRRDAAGAQIVQFTSGHIIFRQSLLVRAEDAQALDSYQKLRSETRVGALAATTGEQRLLELTGLIDAEGRLAAGVQVETAQGIVTADGGDDFVITPAGASPSLAGRVALKPPSADMPQVIYLDSAASQDDLIASLLSETIDAIAGGDLGNQASAAASDGTLVVAAYDDKIEYGGFTVDSAEPALAACLDEKIDWLTDEGRIGFADWVEDPAVFMQRAQLWNNQKSRKSDRSD